MNNVSLIGRLTRDPELRYTTGNDPKAVARFTLAISEGYGDNERTSFVPIVVWGKTAENCEKYLAKGRMAAVTGRIQTGSYEKDGRTIYTTDVIASRVEFLGGGEKRAENEAQEPQQASALEDVPTGFQSVDDDIPF